LSDSTRDPEASQQQPQERVGSSRREFLAKVAAGTAVAALAASSASALARAESRSGVERERTGRAAGAGGVVQVPALPGAQPISPTDRVYTADQTSNTVTVINPATNTVLGTIPMGDERLDMLLTPIYNRQVNTHGLGFSPDGRLLDVINVTSNAVVLVDTATNTVKSTSYVGRAPHEGFISPDGRELWVAVHGQDYVSVIDVASAVEKLRITTADGPSKVVFSPDGHYAYVNHIRAAEVDVINVANHAVSQRITGLVDVFSSDEAISPDGAELWAAHKMAGKVSVIDARSFRVLTVLDTGPVTNHPNFVSTPTANYAYVTVGGLDQTLVYARNGATPTLVDRITNTGSTPHGIWPSPDNTRVYVVLENSDAMDVIDTTTRKVIATLRIGQEPQALVYVANAVPTGDGTANLTQQGLNKQVINQKVDVPGGTGTAAATVRQVQGVDMINVRGRQLPPKTTFTVYATKGNLTIPLADLVIPNLSAGVVKVLRWFAMACGPSASSPAGKCGGSKTDWYQ